MADDVRRQHELTKSLETATRFREGADTRWRAAIAEALAAGVPRDVILKAAGGWDVIEVQDVLRELDQRKSRAAVDVDGRRATAEDEELSHSTPV